MTKFVRAATLLVLFSLLMLAVVFADNADVANTSYQDLPAGWAVFLAIVGSLITLLLGVIGILLKYGIDAIRGDINKIWEWITEDTKGTSLIKEELRAIKERCALLHKDPPKIGG